MTELTRIERGLYWDRAWSLIEGCSPKSEACRSCWSAAQTHMRARQSNPKTRARYERLTDARGRFNGTVRAQYDSLYQPLRVRKPTTWALWNDLWHKDIPDDFIGLAVAVMSLAYWHTFVVLTKRAQRMCEFLGDEEMLCLLSGSQSMVLEDEDCPVGPGRGWNGLARRRDDARATAPDIREPLSNVIWGVTAEDQPAADERIPWLLRTPAATRVVSLEPLLEPVDPACPAVPHTGVKWPDWWIVGCESGPQRRPTADDWVRKVRDHCVDVGAKFFLKQQVGYSGKLEKLPELDGKQWAQMPEVMQ